MKTEREILEQALDDLERIDRAACHHDGWYRMRVRKVVEVAKSGLRERDEVSGKASVGWDS